MPSLHVAQVRPEVNTNTTVSGLDAAMSMVVNGRDICCVVPMNLPRWNRNPWRGEFGLGLSMVITIPETSAHESKLLCTGMSLHGAWLRGSCCSCASAQFNSVC